MAAHKYVAKQKIIFLMKIMMSINKFMSFNSIIEHLKELVSKRISRKSNVRQNSSKMGSGKQILIQ